MEKTIELDGRSVLYTVRVSRRARAVRLEIDGTRILVTRPWFVPEIATVGFMHHKAAWILKHLGTVRKSTPQKLLYTNQTEYEQKKGQAGEYLSARVDYYNQFYNFYYQRVSIRRQRSIWGSCSRSGNLQFNYLLLEIPTAISDYVVVHELCHLEQPNHSAKFWHLVERVVPEYKQLRKQLRGYQIRKRS